MLLSSLVCLMSWTACTRDVVIVPSDMVPVRIVGQDAAAPADGAPILRIGEALPEAYNGWWVISPGAMRRLYRQARAEVDGQ